MVLGLIWAVYPVMTGALVSHGMLYLSVPVVLGLAGAILAVVQRRLGWAMVAGVWGVLPDVVSDRAGDGVLRPMNQEKRNDPMPPCPDEAAAARTSAGKWTKVKLAAWGVSWPPPKGWREELERRWAGELNVS